MGPRSHKPSTKCHFRISTRPKDMKETSIKTRTVILIFARRQLQKFVRLSQKRSIINAQCNNNSWIFNKKNWKLKQCNNNYIPSNAYVITKILPRNAAHHNYATLISSNIYMKTRLQSAKA